ncbi:MAG: class I SAM-dependent methyltransferase [Alphaproteobacteria bacterium]|nr:class I SAM-dependent methyltransferase [Alphaproteobacteria bacterium]
MSDTDTSAIFDQSHAAAREKQFAKLAPIREALHLLMRMVFAELPAKARVLCVGVGTGAELVYLANAFPKMVFTLVDPSAPMLDICRQRAKERKIEDRCTFHEGYLDTLAGNETFDAATALMVSQFFADPADRSRFFAAIAARLRPKGILVSSDLAADQSLPTFQGLNEVWIRTLTHTGVPARQAKTMGSDVALAAPDQVAKIIASGGFDQPVLFLQTALIHAWYAVKA